MNALEEFRSMIEEHWPHSNPYWREGDMQFAPTIDAIADRIEAEYMELPKDADGEVIHVGDMVDLEYGSDKTVEVYGVNDHAIYTQGGCYGGEQVELVKPSTKEDIADRIKAEYVELPKDADGVPCKIGDYVRSGETCGNIKEMLWYKRGWELYLTTLDDSVSADAVRHVKPDSYETLHSDLKSCTNKATADDFITRAKALAGVEQ